MCVLGASAGPATLLGCAPAPGSWRLLDVFPAGFVSLYLQLSHPLAPPSFCGHGSVAGSVMAGVGRGVLSHLFCFASPSSEGFARSGSGNNRVLNEGNQAGSLREPENKAGTAERAAIPPVAGRACVSGAKICRNRTARSLQEMGVNRILSPPTSSERPGVPPRTFASFSKEERISETKFAASSTHILKCFHLAPIPICVFLCKHLHF